MINQDTLLSDIVLDDTSVITVLNRFGITLGVGDMTVRQVCARYNLDPMFFIIILNTYTNKDYFPEKALSAFSIEMLVDYINKTNAYYEHFQLPNIDRHFQFLLAKSDPSKSNLAVIKQFYDEVKAQLLERISNDRTEWFPSLLKSAKSAPSAIAKISDYYIDDDNESVESKLDDLITMIVIHLKGEYDVNLCHAVFFALSSLRQDITKNNRIRSRILRPISNMLSRQPQ